MHIEAIVWAAIAMRRAADIFLPYIGIAGVAANAPVCFANWAYLDLNSYATNPSPP